MLLQILNGGTPSKDDDDYNSDIYMTPFDIFFNKYRILDVNFFDFDELEKDSFIYKFRSSVASWFYVMRLIASGILLCILIYVGIRMGLSTVADDKARYKKMLADWLCSLILIFVLQYMAIAVINVNNIIVNALDSILTADNKIDINNIMNDLVELAAFGVGTSSLIAVFVFGMIIGQTIFFFIAYINRMLKIGFLIIISPLISLTYSIDKMGDGKAQALNIWLKEFIYSILIQPFHCIMYIALINTAFRLLDSASYSPFESLPEMLNTLEFNQLANGVLAILCLKFVSDGEKIVRKIFGFADDNTKTSMGAGAIAAIALVSNAAKVGATARKGINTAKNTTRRLGTAFGNDYAKIKNSNLYVKFSNKLVSPLA